jgi:hypothetical protein
MERPPDPISLESFLLTCPPGNSRVVTVHLQDSDSNEFKVPSLEMYCESEYCNGNRRFRWNESYGNHLPIESKPRNYIFTYICGNCRKAFKTFVFRLTDQLDENDWEAYKFGEYPRFGPVIPPKVLTLIREDKELFIKGRNAESLGLGIAAFTYYRRVVESQKSRIFQQIISVAIKLGGNASLISELEDAKNETQFSKAVGKIKHALPDSLRTNNHNPLTLLHDALSEGVHELSDEKCLELATDIRNVLTAFSEKVSNALKDEAGFDDSVNRLLKRKQEKQEKKD